jgi:hypothetical protein
MLPRLREQDQTMADDIDKLRAVLDHHPWLADALREGDWWPLDDGTVRFRAKVPPGEDTLAGLAALADVVGCELTVGAAPDNEDPEGDPLSLDDLRRAGWPDR